MRQASLYYHFPSKEQLFVSVGGGCLSVIELEYSMPWSRQTKLRPQLFATYWFLSQPPINFLSMMQADMPSLSESAKLRLRNVNQAIFEPIGQALQLLKQITKLRCPT